MRFTRTSKVSFLRATIMNLGNVHCITNTVVFGACACIGLIALYLIRLSIDIDADRFNVNDGIKTITDIQDDGAISSHLKFKGPDANGKVKVVISLDAKEVADFLDKSKRDAAVAVRDAPVTNLNVSILLHKPNLCGNASNLTYIVYVISTLESQVMRNNLRTTWASPRLFKGDTSRLIFLVGIPDPGDKYAPSIRANIRTEFDLHGDIVQGDFVDTVRNGTLKSIMGLMWVSQFCPQAAYAVRVNDDSFVNIFEVMRMMQMHARQRWVMMCPQWKDNSMPILRNPKDCGGWCVADTDLPGRTHFPQYCASVVTILSRELVGALYRASFHTPFFWISDVYVTGLLPKKLPKHIHYLDMLEMMSFNGTQVLQQYTDTSSTLTLTIARLNKMEQFRAVWTALLKRLPPAVFQTLSDSSILQIA